MGCSWPEGREQEEQRRLKSGYEKASQIDVKIREPQGCRASTH